jgi:hypothetical protein
MRFAVRGLVLLLLAIDWAEDTHFGTYIFSVPMASSLVDPLDTGFHPETTPFLIVEKSGSTPAIAEFGFVLLFPVVAQQDFRIQITSYFRDSLYHFMSLQQ